MNEVTVTTKRFDDDVDQTGPTWLEYRCGVVGLAIDASGHCYMDSGEYTTEELRDLATLLAHPDIQKMMHPNGSPEAARAAVVAALDNPRRMPSAAETLDLIANDRVSSWLWWRACEWCSQRIAQGYDVSMGKYSEKHAQRFDHLLMKTLKALDESKPLGKLGSWYMTLTSWERRKAA